MVSKIIPANSLAATLATAFVVLTIFAVLIASSFQFWLNFVAQQEIVANTQKVIAISVAENVSGVIQTIFSTLEATAQTGQPFSKSVAERSSLLNSVLRLQPYFVEVALLNGRGHELTKVSRLQVFKSTDLQDLAGSELFVQVSQNKPYISPLRLDEETKEPLVTLAVPIQDLSFQFEGALVAQVNLYFMWELMVQTSQGSEAYLVDKQGRLIAFSDTSRILEDISQLTKVAEFIRGQKSTAETSFEISTGIGGETVLASYISLERPDWAVVVEIPVLKAYRKMIFNLIMLFGGSLLIAGVAGLVGVYLARRLVAPLLHLTETATQIAAGHLELEAPVHASSPHEVRRLALAFNSMTTQLRELIQSLEQRVLARTQRLETVATIGEHFNSILDFDKLLFEIGREIKSNFGYYQTFIYLLDEAKEELVLVEGGDEIATKLKLHRHTIPLAAASLVARAARTGQMVLEANVHETADWLPNPQLPETQSEIAVPILLHKKVVGVLDVQQNQQGQLDETDVNTLRSLANQIAVALNNARLFTHIQETNHRLQQLNEQLQTELVLARKIQQGLLAPAWPTLVGLEIGCYSTSAREVGGDFYAYQDFTNYDPGHHFTLATTRQYALAVGDVSGKGMPAALLMGVSLALFSAMLEQATNPAELLGRLDQALVPYNRTTHQNCALCYVEIALKPNQSEVMMSAANAGCIPPLILRTNQTIEWIDVGGMPLGVGLGSQWGYQEKTVTLYPGEFVILCSDGLVEAKSSQGEMFGFERLEQLVAANPRHNTSAMEMMAHLQFEISAFMGHTELHDDLTILVIKI